MRYEAVSYVQWSRELEVILMGSGPETERSLYPTHGIQGLSAGLTAEA